MSMVSQQLVAVADAVLLAAALVAGRYGLSALADRWGAGRGRGVRRIGVWAGRAGVVTLMLTGARLLLGTGFVGMARGMQLALGGGLFLLAVAIMAWDTRAAHRRARRAVGRDMP